MTTYKGLPPLPDIHGDPEEAYVKITQSKKYNWEARLYSGAGTYLATCTKLTEAGARRVARRKLAKYRKERSFATKTPIYVI